MSTEKWKIINQISDYECSDMGNFRNKNTGRILKQKLNKKGYLKINLKINGKPSSYSCHRIIAKTWIENPDNKPTVDHINRIRSDNRVINLRWATYIEQSKNRKDNKINHNRGVWKCDKKTGEKIQFFSTLQDVINNMNLSNKSITNISACALGKTKTAYGYSWIYRGCLIY